MPTTTSRDIQARLPLAIEQDTFSRASTAGNATPSNAAGWGNPSDFSVNGETWARASGAASATYSISASNTGHVTANTGQVIVLLGSSSYQDLEVLVRLQASSTSDTLGIALRCSGATNTSYRLRLLSGTTLRFDKNNAGTTTTIANFTFTWSASTKYWLRARISATTFQARVWADGSAEPSANTWHITAADNTFASGQVGLFFNNALSGDTADFDSFVVTDAPQNGYRTISSRARVQGQSTRDIATRALVAAARDIVSRIKLTGTATRDLAARARVGEARDVWARLRVGEARDVPTRVRLGKARDVASRLRLGAARDIWTRVFIVTQPVRDIWTRIPIQGNPLPAARDLALRLLVATSSPPSGGAQPAGPAMAGVGLVPLSPLPRQDSGAYLNAGVALVTQPYLASAPVATSGQVLAGTLFTLAFANADASTRAILGTPGQALSSFTFATSEGATLSGAVQVVSAATLAGNNLLVTLQVTQTLTVNQWVVPAQSL